MKYRDEIHIAMMALVFSCAMFAVYAVVPKDAAVAAKARATITEAPETAAEAEAIRSEEDPGFNIYTEESNYDYDSSSDDSGSDQSYYDNSDTGTDNSDTDSSYVDPSTDTSYDDGSNDDVIDEGTSEPGDYDYSDETDDSGDGFTYYEPDNTVSDDTSSSDSGDYVEG